jgi:sec-independent protein translocase protein TatC
VRESAEQSGADRESADQEQPFVSHLLELRDRLLRMVAAVFVVFLCLFPFANDIYLYVAEPLMAHMPEGTSMIATGVATPFLTPFKLSLMAAVFLSMPFLLYQFWAFVAPGLYRHEKKLVMPLLVSSSILFYTGMAFAYYVVFPLVFAFFIGTTPDGVAVMTDIAQYLDFVITLFFAFGVAFEVPIATILVVWMGMTTPQNLATKRPYIIVGAFVVGMLLTPPDVISQTLLALPMWVLFETGIQFSKFFVRDRDGGAEAEEAEAADAPRYEPRPAGGAGAGSAAGEEVLVGADIDGGDHTDPDRYAPLSDEELEAHLDAAEADEAALEEQPGTVDAADTDQSGGQADQTSDRERAVDAKLRRVQELRAAEDYGAARALLYQVLEEGDADQRRVARNILQQLDMP